MSTKAYIKAAVRDLGVTVTGWGVAASFASVATGQWALMVAGLAGAIFGSIMVWVGRPKEDTYE